MHDNLWAPAPLILMSLAPKQYNGSRSLFGCPNCQRHSQNTMAWSELFRNHRDVSRHSAFKQVHELDLYSESLQSLYTRLIAVHKRYHYVAWSTKYHRYLGRVQQGHWVGRANRSGHLHCGLRSLGYSFKATIVLEWRNALHHLYNKYHHYGKVYLIFLQSSLFRNT